MTNKRNNSKVFGVRQRAHENIDRVMDGAERIKNRGSKAMYYLKEKSINARNNIDGYIEENPEKSVLIAVGIGVIVASILSRIMARRRA